MPPEDPRFARHTWPEARAAFGPDLVVLLPLGATEPHGPHLPLDVDVTIAEAQARRAAALLAEQGVRAWILPPLAFGVTFFTDGFEGRVTIHPGTLWALLEDIAESLAEQGLRRLVLVNAHLEPAQIKVLRGIAKEYELPRPGKLQIVFPDHTRRRFVGRLSSEFQSGDCHAGSYETSIVMHADPGAVREDQRRALPQVKVGLIEGFAAGKQNFRQLGADQAYCGAPAEASAAEGAAQLEALAAIVLDALRETWPELFVRRPG
jgi:creatinine amidohydrolase